jgi:ankyrin repeat protein
LFTEKKDRALTDSLGRTPLWLATKESHEDAMRELSRVDRISFTLMLDKKESTLAYFLLQVAGNMIRGSRSRTALHIGVIRSDLDLIRRALQRGIEIDARDADGHSAIQLAFQTRQTSAINLLLEKSASTEGITVSSWLEAHGNPSSKIFQLSEDEKGQKQVVLLEARDFTRDYRRAISDKTRLR